MRKSQHPTVFLFLFYFFMYLLAMPVNMQLVVHLVTMCKSTSEKLVYFCQLNNKNLMVKFHFTYWSEEVNQSRVASLVPNTEW